MRARTLFWVVVAFLLAPPATAAPVLLIDFESLQHADALAADVGTIYSEDGFQFLADHPIPGNPDVFRTLGTLHPGFAGSTALSQGVSNGEIILTRADGIAFNLESISFAEHPSLAPGGTQAINGGAFDIHVFGDRPDGTIVENVVHVSGFLELRPFFFTGFEDVLSVRWFQGGGGSSAPTHQFDDVRVTVVSEPQTGLLLLLSGFVALITRNARRPAVMWR